MVLRGVIKEKARAMRLDSNLPWQMWPEITRAAVYLYNRTPNYANRWRSPYELFFTTTALQNGIVTQPKKPNQTHLKAYGCKAFAMTDDTKRGKSKLQRLDPKAWIGYLVGYRSSNIWRIWIPSLAKTISTRDAIFDEDTVFSGKTEDLTDNLMHNTLEEIATWIRTVELPPTPQQDQSLESFYEDETIIETPAGEGEGAPGYRQGRKVGYEYPTPPSTPPPVTLLAQLMAGEDKSASPGVSTGLLQTSPWAAAFMAGTEAGGSGTHKGKVLDKAQLHRMITAGKKPHRSVLPEPPTCREKLEDHLLYDMWKEAERSHL